MTSSAFLWSQDKTQCVLLICPGDPFYEKERNVSTFRINYSNSSDEVIEKGIRILGEACAELIAKKDN